MKKLRMLLDDFGPRPEGAKKLILDYKATHGVVDEPAKSRITKMVFARQRNFYSK